MNTITVKRTANRQLAEKEIEQYLPLYKPDHITIDQASYDKACLSARFRHYALDYHKEPLSHLSRVQIVHYIGQAAYVLGACLAGDDRFNPLTLDDYLERVQDERATFYQLKLNFRNYLPNEAGTTIRIWLDSKRRSHGNFHVVLKFELNDGSCYGDAHAIIVNADTSEE